LHPLLDEKVGCGVRKEIGFRLREVEKVKEENSRKKYLEFFGRMIKNL
jgi:hypothetical protein